MRQKFTKFISLLLAGIIVCASSWTVISYATETYKTATELESQGTVATNENVEFDVYYAGGTHTSTIDMEETEAKIYIKTSVKNVGYLENAKIDLSACNFNIADDESNSGKIQSIDIQGKTVVLNRIVAGSEVEIALNITPKNDDKISTDEFKKDNVINFSGTYINQNAEEVTVTKEIILHTTWTATLNATITQELVKYIPFNVSGKSGLLVQTEVATGVEKNLLPIKESTVTVSVPSIMETKPEKVIVFAKTTECTNGDKTGLNFTSDNYTYDEAEGKIIIKTENVADSNGTVSWIKGVEDKYEVVFIYSEEVANLIESSTSPTVEFSSMVQNSYYGKETTENAEGNISSVSKVETLGVEKGSIVDYEAGIKEAEIAKGYIYNNKVAIKENKIETTYTESFNLSTSYADLVDEIVMEQKVDSLIDEEEIENSTTIDGSNFAYNKKVRVYKSEFTKILGETGYIDIVSGTTVIARIDNTKEANPEGYIEIDISSYNTNNIQIKSSAPQTEGSLNVEVDKAISKEVTYSKTQLESFKSLKSSSDLVATLETVEVAKLSVEDRMNLLEPTSKTSISINKTELSTLVKNENVEIKILLEANSADDKLYSNPTIEITLPSDIKVIELELIDILYTNELNIVGDVVKTENADGTITLTIQTEGTITKYDRNGNTNGPVILINANIELEKFAASTQTVVMVKIADSNGTTATNFTPISYIAPVELITTSEISNYSEKEGTLETYNKGDIEEKVTGTIEANADARQIIITKNVVNNYDTSINNVKILGRTFYVGNKIITNGIDLGSTIELPLATEITIKGENADNYTVYYSNNKEATSDLTDISNEWNSSASDLSQVKSYLIVANDDGIIEHGEAISIEYSVTIPANIAKGESSYENYAVYFDSELENEVKTYVVQTTATGLTTGESQTSDNENGENDGTQQEGEQTSQITATMNATISNGTALQNGADVEEGEYITYILKIKNNGNTTLENVSWRAPIPQNATYASSDYTDDASVENIGQDSITLMPNEEKTVTFMLKVGSLIEYGYVEITDEQLEEIGMTREEFFEMMYGGNEEGSKSIDLNVTITVNNIETPVQYSNNIVKGYLHVIIYDEANSDAESIEEGKILGYRIIIVNANSITKNNVTFTLKLPDEIEYTDYTCTSGNIEYDSDTHTITFIQEQMAGRDVNYIRVNGKAINPNNVQKKNITLSVTVTCDELEGKTVASNEISELFFINNPTITLQAEQTCNYDSKIARDTAEIIYYLTINNTGTSNINNIEITDIISGALKDITYNVSIGDESYDGTIDFNNFEQTISLEAGKTAVITIKAKPYGMDEGKTVEVENNFIVEVSGKTIPVNSIKFTIEGTGQEEPEEPDPENPDPENPDPENPSEEEKIYQILGMVWLDTNSDGIRNSNEKGLENIEVMLVDRETGDIVINSKENKELIVTTNNNGEYCFENITKGKYLVLAIYDDEKYEITTYKNPQATENINSDFTKTTAIIYGKTTTVAITDTITIENNDIANIDLGLRNAPIFDLNLTKTVSKITIQAGNDVSEHNYDKNLAKIDFTKKDINGSMIVEYKITVTNEGNVPGYATKIADYIPEGMKFYSELNSIWYTEGEIAYSTALANILINPGESKEITLILAQKMSDNALGTIVNTAEIIESTNERGLKDVDKNSDTAEIEQSYSYEAEKNNSGSGDKNSNGDTSDAIIVAGVKTGQEYIYIGLILVVISIIGIGTYEIKTKILR